MVKSLYLHNIIFFNLFFHYDLGLVYHQTEFKKSPQKSNGNLDEEVDQCWINS